jgi:hypothetical protein
MEVTFVSRPEVPVGCTLGMKPAQAASPLHGPDAYILCGSAEPQRIGVKANPEHTPSASSATNKQA